MATWAKVRTAFIVLSCCLQWRCTCPACPQKLAQFLQVSVLLLLGHCSALSGPVQCVRHTLMCRKEEATPTKSETRSASQQQVWNPDSHDDSDSEDSQPLCDLAADSIPVGQLVAKRTPFQAFAVRPFSQHVEEEALQDDRCVTCTLLDVVHLHLSMCK